MISRFSELGIVPELVAGPCILLNAKLLQSGDIVFVCNLIHLGVGEHLIGVTCNRGAFVADKVVAVVRALAAAGMMRTDLTVITVRVAMIVARVLRARVRVRSRCDATWLQRGRCGQNGIVLSLV